MPVPRHLRVAWIGAYLCGLLSLSHGQPEAPPIDEFAPRIISPGRDVQVQHGISLFLSVDTPEVNVGDEIRFRLAFQNETDELAVVVPPLDGSWDDMEQPAYNVEFIDAEGKPVLHALGYENVSRCGMTEHYEFSHRRFVEPHGTFELEYPPAWAGPFPVLKHARPGDVWLRVRYRADELPGVQQIEIVSNPVKITIRGSDETLWKCSNALVEKSEIYDYVENQPVKLIAHDTGYWVVFRRNVIHVRGKSVTGTHFVSIQPLDLQGQPVGEAIAVGDYESGSRWPRPLEVVEVPNGLLVAYATTEDDDHGEIRLVPVMMREGKLQVGPARPIMGASGNPVSIALARSGDRIGIAWAEDIQRSALLWFRSIDLNGEDADLPRLMPTGVHLTNRPLILAPVTNGFVLAWHEWNEGLQLQRLGRQGELVGHSNPGPTGSPITAFALQGEKDRIRLAYHSWETSESVELSALDFKRVSKSESVPFRRRYGDVVWANGQLFGIVDEYQKLTFNADSKDNAEEIWLSKTFARDYDVATNADGSKLLVTWKDYRHSDPKKCAYSGACTFESYIAVFDSNMRALIYPKRVTTTSTLRPTPLYEVDFRAHCGEYFKPRR